MGNPERPQSDQLHDGAFQERTKNNGAAYAFNDETPGDGKNELRFTCNSLPKITDLAGAGRVITWNSIPGRNYQVFTTTNVNAPFTALNGTLTASTSPMSFTNPAPVRSREFYRVLVLP